MYQKGELDPKLSVIHKEACGGERSLQTNMKKASTESFSKILPQYYSVMKSFFYAAYILADTKSSIANHVKHSV